MSLSALYTVCMGFLSSRGADVSQGTQTTTRRANNLTFSIFVLGPKVLRNQ